jgi:hypothetical protein
MRVRWMRVIGMVVAQVGLYLTVPERALGSIKTLFAVVSDPSSPVLRNLQRSADSLPGEIRCA